MKCLLTILLSVLTFTAYAQKEAAVWYFGKKAGLDFGSGIPQVLTDGQIDSFEGCATISTPEGSLLFYTNGETVWNRQHEIMENGTEIGGNESATQAALIVPRPNNPNIFYIFTPDAVQFYQGGGTGGGFNYSVVDMSSGLGRVVEKRNSLLPNASEKITAVAARDGQDIWVITQYQDSFYSYRVGENGINTTPVVSSVAFEIEDFNNIRGSIKASPDGTRIAITHTLLRPQLNGRLLLYDFDNATGIVSGEQQLGTNFGYYGIEFSSNSSKLYASGKYLNNADVSSIGILQYDMNSADIQASEFVMDRIETTFLSDISGTLQLAIDKKVYFTLPRRFLSVIEKPNLSREQALFKRFEFDLEGEKTEFGLPPFVQSFFESAFDFENICYGDTTVFTPFPELPIASIQWNFGDPDSDTGNISSSLNPTHVFTAPGPYIVRADVTFSNGRPAKRFIEVVNIRKVPSIDEPLQLFQCDISEDNNGLTIFNLMEIEELFEEDTEEYSLEFYRSRANAEDQQNALDPIGYENSTNGEIVFVRVFTDPSCYSIFELQLIAQDQSAAANLTLTLCEINEESADMVSLDGVFELLSETYPETDISLYVNEVDALLEIRPIVINTFTITDLSNPQLFYRIESENNCDFIGGLLFNLEGEVDIEDQNVYLCANGEQTLGFDRSYNSYSWSTGETTSSIRVTEAGQYEVTVSDGPGCTDTAVFTVQEAPAISIEVEVEDFRQHNRITVFASSEINPLFYSIDGGRNFQESPVFGRVPLGEISVVVSDMNQCVVETKIVTIRGAPRFFTPNNDGFNDFYHVKNSNLYQGIKLTIYDRFGKRVSTLNSKSQGWDGTYAGREAPSGGYWYAIEYEGETYTGYFALIRR